MKNLVPGTKDYKTEVVYPFHCYEVKEVKEKFNPSPYERDLRPKHVKEIKEVMLRGGYMPSITVNLRTLNIIDGQHRWRAWIDAVDEGCTDDLKVEFVDEPLEKEYVLFRFLNSGLSASNKDIFKVAVDNGVTNVTKLNDFAKSHAPFTWNRRSGKAKIKLVETLIFGSPKGGYAKKHGDYDNITDEMLTYADIIATEVQKIFELAGFDGSGSKDSTFSGAWWIFRQRNPYTNGYNNVNAEAVDKIGLEKFTKRLKDYVIDNHGFDTLNQTDWTNAFFEVTYEFAR